MLGAVLLLATLNMLGSFLTAESVENDAVRINLAGSLRMQSYRIAEGLLIENSAGRGTGNQNMLEARIEEFDERFYRPVLSEHLRNSENQELASDYLALEARWIELKKALRRPEPDLLSLRSNIDSFVVEVNALVDRLAQQTENKFKLLRIFQGASLLLTIMVLVLGYIDVNRNVVAPLKKLLVAAGKVQDGNFSTRLKVSGKDELSTLSDTFNQMSSSLEAMYQNLEGKILEKTKHLEQARDELALLYAISRILSGDESLTVRMEKSLIRIELYFRHIDIYVGLSPELAKFGMSRQLLNTRSNHNLSVTQFEIERQGHRHGRLVINSRDVLVDEHRALLQAIADNFAAALDEEQRQDQHHRLILMEERTVIARELHDSLAQSLSYLKIQFSRMQMLKAKGGSEAEFDSTVGLIKSGIDTAYHQLRELLATFRLQLSNEGLKNALEKTVVEFNDRSGVVIALDYAEENLQLSPNEEIHMLQIVRESLSNVVRHSQANSCQIQVRVNKEADIIVTIEDDGLGFVDEQVEDGHYGKVIMQERARVLGGEVSFLNNEAGGATVELVFRSDIADPKKLKTEQVA